MIRPLILVVLLLWALPNGSPPQEAARSGAGEYRISTSVDLVVLAVAVFDSAGRRVSGLTKENFVVREDGRVQEIKLFAVEDAPLTIGLVIDSSSSMAPKRSELIQAVLTFARSSNPKDEMFVVYFNERVRLGLPSSMPFTDDPEVLAETVKAAPAMGRTALYDGISTGLKQVVRGKHARKALVVFSDGGDNASRVRLEGILRAVHQSDSTVYTIGLYDERDQDRNPAVLKRLAAASGGTAQLPGGVEGIEDACRRIAQDLRSRYTIGYVPANRTFDGAFRRIQVSVAAPTGGKLRARARAGYLAPSAPAEAQLKDPRP